MLFEKNVCLYEESPGSRIDGCQALFEWYTCVFFTYLTDFIIFINLITFFYMIPVFLKPE